NVELLVRVRAGLRPVPGLSAAKSGSAYQYCNAAPGFRWRSTRATSLRLLRKLRAGLGLLAPILHALRVVHRAFADDLGEHEIRDVLDFPVLQGGRWVGHAVAGLPQIGLLEAVATAVAIGELVERRHAGAGQAAFDGHDQGGAVEAGFAQIGAVRHLRIHLAAVAGPAMAGLAVALLPEQTGALGNVARVRGLSGEMHGRREQYERERRERYSCSLHTGRPNSLTVLTHAFASGVILSDRNTL